jgi:cell division initiation protein
VKITPLDLRKQEFKKGMRGYDVHEVDAFLEMVAKEMEELLRENSVMTERLRELDDKIDDYRSMEKTLQGTLTSAQKTADDLRKNAEKEAELVLRNTKIKATHLVEDARGKMADLQAEVAALEEQKEVFIARFKSMIEIQQRLLDAHATGGKKPVAKSASPAPAESVAAASESRTVPRADFRKLGSLFFDTKGTQVKGSTPEP